MQKIKIALLLMLILLLSSCMWYKTSAQNIDTTNLSQLENVETQPRKALKSQTELSQLRLKALKDTAMSLGAQAGLTFETEQIDHKLEKDKKYLSTIYNFNAMVLSHGVIPPVLAEGDFSLNLDDPNTIRVADKTYQILQQARFATTPPNWRDYLWMSYSKPELPDHSLLPRNKAEQHIWKKGVRLGWDKGIEQAHTIFQQNLARLKRDYQGMMLYRKLLQENMISQPFVARTELGVTGTGEDMRINDQVLRIVELPKLQTESKRWQAIVVKR